MLKGRPLFFELSWILRWFKSCVILYASHCHLFMYYLLVFLCIYLFTWCLLVHLLVFLYIIVYCLLVHYIYYVYLFSCTLFLLVYYCTNLNILIMSCFNSHLYISIAHFLVWTWSNFYSWGPSTSSNNLNFTNARRIHSLWTPSVVIFTPSPYKLTTPIVINAITFQIQLVLYYNLYPSKLEMLTNLKR